MNVEFIPSPNYTPSRFGISPSLVICHWMAGTLEGTIQHFQNKDSQVSAHFGVGRNGRVVQFVPLRATAWHSGHWLTNLKSIGIEFEGAPGVAITEEAYRSGRELLKLIQGQTGIVPSEYTVFPHNHFKATQCPGTLDIPKLLSVDPFWGIDQPVSVNAIEAVQASYTPIVTQVPISFVVVVYAPLGTANFRTEPRLGASVARTYPNGTEVECIETVNGDSVTITGRTGTVTTSRWYKSLRSGFYISAAVSIRK